MLEQLFTLYPKLFGARFVPLQRGVFEALMERHPEQLKREDLKIALAQHTQRQPVELGRGLVVQRLQCGFVALGQAIEQGDQLGIRCGLGAHAFIV